MIQILCKSAETKFGKNRSSVMTSVAGGSKATRSLGSLLFSRPKRIVGSGKPAAEALRSGTRTLVPLACISTMSTVNGTLMNFRIVPVTRSSPF